MSTQIVTTDSLELFPTKAPALPFPPDVYAREYHNQLNSILRLYFNTLDNFVAQLQAESVSAALKVPYGAFSCFSETTLSGNITNVATTIGVVSTASFPTATVGDPKAFYIGNETITYTGKTSTSFTGCVRGALGTTAAAHLSGVNVEGTQIMYSASTAYPLFFNTTDFSNDASVVDTTKMTVDKAGIYNLQFSVQLQNEDNSPRDVFIWLRQNGTDIVGSTGKVGMPARKGVNDPSHDIKGWNYFLSMDAGDYVEIWWSTTGVNVTIPNYAITSSPTKPSTASVVATITFVSAI